MATITLSVTLDSGPSVSTSVTVLDADAQRMSNALSVLFNGATNVQILRRALLRVMQYAVELTKTREQAATPVVPITFS